MKSTNNQIKKVNDNNEKYMSYKSNIKQFNKAKAAGFYFECLWILYALIEDRTSAFLYYLGFTSEEKRSSVTGTKKIKNEIREMLKIKQGNAKYYFNTLSGKLSRINELLILSKEESANTSDYQQEVIKVLQALNNLSEFESAANYLKSGWVDKRNQLTHALFNKDYASATDEVLPMIEEGYIAVRQIDAAVKTVKKHNIRAHFNIQ